MSALKAVLKDKKFWVALVGLVAGIAVSLGFDENLVAAISGGSLSVVSVVMLTLMGVDSSKQSTLREQTPDQGSIED